MTNYKMKDICEVSNFKPVSLIIVWLGLLDHENVICPWKWSKVYEFPSAVTNHHNLGWLSTIELCSLTALEAQRPKSRCWQGIALPWKVLRENPSLSLPASGGPRHSLAVAASFQSLPPSSNGLFFSMCLSSLCLLEGHLSLDLGPTCTIQDDLISRFLN